MLPFGTITGYTLCGGRQREEVWRADRICAADPVADARAAAAEGDLRACAIWIGFTQRVPSDLQLRAIVWAEVRPPLGDYRIVVDRIKGPSQVSWGDQTPVKWSSTFAVLAYRKPEMELKVELVASPDERSMTGKISAAYLFGAPVSEAEVTWTVERTNVWQWSSYSDRNDLALAPTFGDPLAWFYRGRPDLDDSDGGDEWEWNGAEVANGEGGTDATGSLEVAFELKQAKAHTEWWWGARDDAIACSRT